MIVYLAYFIYFSRSRLLDLIDAFSALRVYEHLLRLELT